MPSLPLRCKVVGGLLQIAAAAMMVGSEDECSQAVLGAGHAGEANGRAGRQMMAYKRTARMVGGQERAALAAGWRRRQEGWQGDS